MKLAEIIRKAADGAPLDEGERAFLRDCRPADEAELAATRDSLRRLEAEKRELAAALPEHEKLRCKFESELAELRTRAEQAGRERDTVRQELARFGFRKEVDRLAARHGFSDPDYLEYLCNSRKVDFTSPENAETLMNELREASPRLFRLELRPGAGAAPSPAPGTVSASPATDIAAMLAEAPGIIE